MSREQKAESAMGLLRELLIGICAHPDMLEVELRTGEAYEIVIACHPVDSRRIVGRKGAHIRALSNLARLLFFGSSKLVTILPVTSPDLEEEPREKMTPNPDWPREHVLNLTQRLAEAVFERARIQVEIVRHNGWSSRVEIYVQDGPANDQVISRFCSAMHTLYVPMGSNMGQILYLNVNQEGLSNVGDRTNMSRGAAARDGSARVRGSKPDSKLNLAQGGPDGF